MQIKLFIHLISKIIICVKFHIPHILDLFDNSFFKNMQGYSAF